MLRLVLFLLFTRSSDSCTSSGTSSSRVRDVQRTEPAATSSDLTSILSGSAKHDGEIPGQSSGALTRGNELNCADFEDCRWHNEVGAENAESTDSMDYFRASGTPDPTRTRLIFGTATNPENKWLVTGTGQKKSPEKSAMLVSDRINCQNQAGRLDFE